MAFFTSGRQLARLFTPPEYRDPAKHGKYSVDGLKPIEAFCSDIMNDLVEWSCEGQSIFYKTHTHWYEFRLEDKGEWKGVVWMTRYDHATWQRIDDWANLSSVRNMGKSWLISQHADKRVPMFEEGRTS